MTVQMDRPPMPGHHRNSPDRVRVLLCSNPACRRELAHQQGDFQVVTTPDNQTIVGLLAAISCPCGTVWRVPSDEMRILADVAPSLRSHMHSRIRS